MPRSGRPHYISGFAWATDRVVRVAAADSLVWAQTCFIQLGVATRPAGGRGTLVLLLVATGSVRDWVTVAPGRPSVA